MTRSSWKYGKNMLANLYTGHGSSKCARRGIVLLFAWGLVMIAALQFRHAENDNSLSIERGGHHKQPVISSSRLRYDERQDDVPPRIIGGVGGGGVVGIGGSSRYLLQRFPVDSTSSYGAGTTTREPMEPLIDKRQPRTEEEIVREIESKLPSLPLAYWLKSSSMFGKTNVNTGKNSTINEKNKGTIADQKIAKTFNDNRNNKQNTRKGCVPRFPIIYELEFNNIYWQSLRTSNGTFQLFGAYYDIRKMSLIGPAIRILGMIDRIEPRVKTYCQMWFENDREPAVIETLEYKYVWYPKWGNYKQGIYQPYLIACKIPITHQGRGPPASVSIVEKPCDTSSNNLRVIYNKADVKRGFAVCVKGLDFLHDDLSVRLIEWIELISLLGADKIFIYQLNVHPNVSKVLDYYTKLGKVEVTPLTLPGGQPNVPAFQHMYLTKKINNKRQNEVIPYNDCLYKHMYEYDYLALLDIDEVIIPLRDSTWPELMKRVMPKALAIRNESRASYNVRNVYFLDKHFSTHGFDPHLPKYMHMLQHVYRSENYSKPNSNVKCFHNTERVLTLHNHFPFACLGSGCKSYPIEIEDAQLHHYRSDCPKSLKKLCDQYRENSVTDTTIWRYKDRLIESVTDILDKLGFFPSKNGLT